MTRRLCALLLAVLLMLCGCTHTAPLPETPAGDTAAPDDAVKQEPTVAAALCWSAHDTLHPYKAVTRVNRELTPLLYEGLTTVAADWSVKAELAGTVEQTDATHLKVTLRQNARFSDGTAVTADDIRHSLALAKASAAYKTLVANVRSIDDTLTVTLAKADTVNAAAALSFPIVRETGEQVIGTGLYQYDGKSGGLTANPYHPTKPATAAWALENITERKDMRYALSAGNIALYTTDMTDSEVPTVTGNVRQTTVTMNHLIYLGISNKRDFANEAFRAGLSLALDRNALCTNAFASYATPTTTPFIPTWKPAIGLTGGTNSENIEQTIEKWKEIGYNVLDNGLTSAKKELPATELLVCKENAFHVSAATLIAEQLGRAGLTVTVAAVSESDYRSRVSNGRFDLYLGEVRLSDDLSLRPWLTPDGAAKAGVPAEAMQAYTAFLAGETSAEEFNRTFTESWPFIPLAWRVGAAVCASSLQGIAPGGADFYNDIQSWIL